MLAYKINRKHIKNRIFIPKYYDPDLYAQITALIETHDLHNLGDLIASGVIAVHTGHAIGKMAYGTGNIPFVRTSDITNLSLIHISKRMWANRSRRRASWHMTTLRCPIAWRRVPSPWRQWSVSYTHLDVYKRQGQHCVAGSMPWQASA